MDNLSFKERIALKMLIKNNRLGEHSINVGFSLINEISVSILLNNIQFLEEVILKAITDRNSLEYDISLEKEKKYQLHGVSIIQMMNLI